MGRFRKRWIIKPRDNPFKILWKTFASERKARSFVKSIGRKEADYTYQEIWRRCDVISKN